MIRNQMIFVEVVNVNKLKCIPQSKTRISLIQKFFIVSLCFISFCNTKSPQGKLDSVGTGIIPRQTVFRKRDCQVFSVWDFQAKFFLLLLASLVSLKYSVMRRWQPSRSIYASPVLTGHQVRRRFPRTLRQKQLSFQFLSCSSLSRRVLRSLMDRKKAIQPQLLWTKVLTWFQILWKLLQRSWFVCSFSGGASHFFWDAKKNQNIEKRGDAP